MKRSEIVALFGLFHLACTHTDTNGDTCVAYDMFDAANGDRYCRDDLATEQCAFVVDAIIDAYVSCGDGAFKEEELREVLEVEGIIVDCDTAVATSRDLDACLAALAEPQCRDGVAVVPTPCVGSVLAQE